MRIIAGTHRGKKLIEYYSAQTRPTTDRVKENVFNLITNFLDLKGARVLDLFAGTGAYGIECLSRGAAFVCFNDCDAAAVKIIQKNIGSTWQNYRLLQTDYTQVPKENYDLIFLDPPYASDYGAQVIAQIKHGLIVFETDREFQHPQIVAAKKYGRARIYLIQK